MPVEKLIGDHRRRRPSRCWSCGGIRAGQDFRAQAVALGAAVASAAEGAGGLGRLGREGLERHHQVQGLSRRSSSARRSTITTWRATASPTSPTSTPAISPAASRSSAPANLPFLMANAKGGSQALDAWYRKYADKEMKDVKFCLAFVHDPGTFHSKTKKIMVPGDIKGMKIRPAHATIATWVTQLGGTNVQSSAPEVRDIIEKGVADAVTFPWGSIPLFGIDKVTKYHMDVPLYATTFAFVFNKAKYDADVGGAEEGDRRPLHQRMGAARSRGPGPTSSTPAWPSSRPIRRTRSIRSRRRSSPSGGRPPSRWRRPGPTTSRRPAAIRTRS